MILKFTYQDEAKRSLGAFLREQGISKQAITESKNNGGLMLVNHRRRLVHYLLQKGDQVHFVTGMEPPNPYLKPIAKELAIVYENDFFMVVNKPAGLLSIPSRFEMDSVVTRALSYFQVTQQKHAKPHVITRLDQDTSGLVLLGKASLAHAMLSRFEQQEFQKNYQAVVHGEFTDTTPELISAPIKKIGATVRHEVNPTGKQAVTEVTLVQNFHNSALVKLRLFTGRTHQIRVHMAYTQHPLFGDQLYGIADGFERQALHCYALTFKDPFTNTTRHFEVPLPHDIQKLIKRLEADKNETDGRT